MSNETIGDAVARLVASYPRAEFDAATVQAYISALDDLPGADVSLAVEELRRSNVFPPSIAEIRRAVIERRLNLPPSMQAWELAADAASSGRLSELPGAVQAAARQVGGSWAIRHTEQPNLLRRDFITAYEQTVQAVMGRELAGDAARVPEFDILRGMDPGLPEQRQPVALAEAEPTLEEIEENKRRAAVLGSYHAGQITRAEMLESLRLTEAEVEQARRDLGYSESEAPERRLPTRKALRDLPPVPQEVYAELEEQRRTKEQAVEGVVPGDGLGQTVEQGPPASEDELDAFVDEQRAGPRDF